MRISVFVNNPLQSLTLNEESIASTFSSADARLLNYKVLKLDHFIQ